MLTNRLLICTPIIFFFLSGCTVYWGEHKDKVDTEKQSVEQSEQTKSESNYVNELKEKDEQIKSLTDRLNNLEMRETLRKEYESKLRKRDNRIEALTKNLKDLENTFKKPDVQSTPRSPQRNLEPRTFGSAEYFRTFIDSVFVTNQSEWKKAATVLSQLFRNNGMKSDLVKGGTEVSVIGVSKGNNHFPPSIYGVMPIFEGNLYPQSLVLAEFYPVWSVTREMVNLRKITRKEELERKLGKNYWIYAQDSIETLFTRIPDFYSVKFVIFPVSRRHSSMQDTQNKSYRKSTDDRDTSLKDNHYWDNVWNHIDGQWTIGTLQIDKKEANTVLRFRVKRDGSIENVTVKKSSGSKEFDNSAKRSLLLANPLPPFPDSMTEPYYDIEFSFRFRP